MKIPEHYCTAGFKVTTDFEYIDMLLEFKNIQFHSGDLSRKELTDHIELSQAFREQIYLNGMINWILFIMSESEMQEDERFIDSFSSLLHQSIVTGQNMKGELIESIAGDEEFTLVIPVRMQLAAMPINILYADQIEKQKSSLAQLYSEGRMVLSDKFHSRIQWEQEYAHELTRYILYTMGEDFLLENSKFTTLFSRLLHQALQGSRNEGSLDQLLTTDAMSHLFHFPVITNVNDEDREHESDLDVEAHLWQDLHEYADYKRLSCKEI